MADKVSQGFNALKSGDKVKARQLLTQAVLDDPRNAAGWLWLSHAVDDITQKRDCLKRVLAITPQSVEAREQLEAIDRLDGISSLPLPTQQLPASKAQALSPPQQPTVQQPAVSTIQAPPRKASSVPLLLLLILIASVVCVIVFIVSLSSLSGDQLLAVIARTSATPIPMPTLPSATPIPTIEPTRDLWPIRNSLSAYPEVSPLELVKRAYAYKNQAVCFSAKVYNVHESKDGTTFNIQGSPRDNFVVIGTVYYPRVIPGLVDGYYIDIGGYVMGTEEELKISLSSRPVILLQRFRWMDLESYSGRLDYTPGDRDTHCGK